MHYPIDTAEENFQLKVGRNVVSYSDAGGELTIGYTRDETGHFDGEDTSFERLYDLLERRSALRVVPDAYNCMIKN